MRRKPLTEYRRTAMAEDPVIKQLEKEIEQAQAAQEPTRQKIAEARERHRQEIEELEAELRQGNILVETNRQLIAIRSGERPAAPSSPSRSNGSRSGRKRVPAAETEAAVLDFLKKNPGSKNGEIAKAISMKPATLSQHLARMVKEGKLTPGGSGRSTTTYTAA